MSLEHAYEKYSCTDFLTDDQFVDHQLQPTTESGYFWDQWLEIHPEKQADWQQAVYLLQALQLGMLDYAKTYLSDSLIQELLEQIQATNDLSEKNKIRPLWSVKKLVWMAAACVIFGLTFGGIWKTFKPSTEYHKHVSSLRKTLIEKTNSSNERLQFQLPDGSAIDLEPNSSLAYSQDFNQADRRVFLTGQATFEVTRNPQKPFMVFANKVVTKVLGTRFKVRAYEAEQEVKVDVETGQVSVFQEPRESGSPDKQSKKGLVLLPNQQAVFSRQTEEFSKTLTEKPSVLAESQAIPSRFVYEEVSISEVFGELEKAYGIPIRFNKEGLAECQLSASLASLSFEQKLDIVCKTINANYQQLDGQIIVNGGSCR